MQSLNSGNSKKTNDAIASNRVHAIQIKIKENKIQTMMQNEASLIKMANESKNMIQNMFNF